MRAPSRPRRPIPFALHRLDQQERTLDDGRPTWRQRLRSILRLRAGGVR